MRARLIAHQLAAIFLQVETMYKYKNGEEYPPEEYLEIDDDDELAETVLSNEEMDDLYEEYFI